MFGLMFPPELSQVSRTRQSTGPGSQTLRQNGLADTEQGMPQGMPQSPSQGLFSAYMNQLFQQKYRPQQALGGYQDMGGFGAFMPPQMAQQAAPQTAKTTPNIPTSIFGSQISPAVSQLLNSPYFRNLGGR